jgi:alpha-1,2-mannosyltransferase
MVAKPTHWLTAKRLRAHGLVLALTLWCLYAWTLATPGLRDRNANLKGTDFLHFYTLGSLAIERRGADLYNIDAQAALAARRVPAAAGIRYLPLYPPQVSVLFAPFAYLSYPWALALWWLCSASIYAICCYVVWRSCLHLRQHGVTVAILAAGFPGFFNLIAWGQTSALALACFTIFFFLMRNNRDFVAGLVLGCLIFKPQLGLAAGALFLLIGAWKIVLGAILSALAQLSIGVLYYGMAPLRTWFSTLGNVRTVSTLLEPKPYQTHCLRTFWSMLIPWSSVSITLYVISAAVLMAWTILVWKRSQEWALRLSALLLATVLVAPHLTVYDLVILAPAFLLLSDRAIARCQTSESGFIGTMLYLAYVLPLAGPLLRGTHVQLSVVAMSILVYLIMKSAKTDLASRPIEAQPSRQVAAT